MFFWKNRSCFFFACLQKLQVWKKSDTEILHFQTKVFSKAVFVPFMIWNPGKSDSFESTSVSLANDLSFSIKIRRIRSQTVTIRGLVNGSKQATDQLLQSMQLLNVCFFEICSVTIVNIVKKDLPDVFVSHNVLSFSTSLKGTWVAWPCLQVLKKRNVIGLFQTAF